MIIDCHVHVAACTAGHGWMSRRLLDSPAFRFMQWRMGVRGNSPALEGEIEHLLAQTIQQTHRLDAAVVLAFDAVYSGDGQLDQPNTHLYVTNDYVMELAARHPKILFGASVHPYRKDAVREIERCVAGGAVLLKWLPIVQNFNPSDARCIPFYEALAHHKLPLLCHTGGEQSLPNLDKSVADPALLEPALRRGVTVIMAHCGSRSQPFEKSYVKTFRRLAIQYEKCFGDTSALGLPTRWYALRLMHDPQVRDKLIHGSDWPIISIPPIHKLGIFSSASLMSDSNWMRRDIKIKQQLGFDEKYWHRAAKVLRLPKSKIPQS